jgi:hypothetical protein
MNSTTWITTEEKENMRSLYSKKTILLQGSL